MEEEKIIFCKSGGCTAKLGAGVLEHILEKLPKGEKDPNLLVGYDSKDDASVYRLTDDLAMDAVKSYAQDGSVAVLALQAGNDMVVTSDPAGDIAAVRQALEQGELTWEQIEAACLRVLQAKLRLGILPMEPQEKNA